MARSIPRPYREISYVVYRLKGPFTVETAPRIMKTLKRIVHPGLRRLVLDLTNTDEVDTSALATLLWGLHFTRQQDVLIEIVGVPARLGALIELYQLEQLFLVSHS